MGYGMKVWGRIASAIGLWAVMIGSLGMAPLGAQSNGGTIAGIILDQAGKTIAGAIVTAKSESNQNTTSTVSDAEGHFSMTNLAGGNYTVEATSPGFARNTRTGVPVSAGQSQDLSITLNVDSITQSVTVHETDLLAVDTAPAGNVLEATSARTEISNAVITNFMPPVADFVFDMRFLNNPHWDPELRPQTGKDPEVGAFVRRDPAYADTFARIRDLLLTLLPRFRAQGKAYVTIAFGCTGGRHRSVFVAEEIAAALREAGFSPTLLHRNLASRAADLVEGGATR